MAFGMSGQLGWGQSGGWLWLLGAASACAFWVLAGLPRPLTPNELPSLRLSAGAVRASLAEDRRRATQVPDTPLAAALDGLFLAQGRADHSLTELRVQRERRDKERSRLVAQLQADSGRDALLALRARAVMRFEEALSDADLPEAELPGILGVFPNQLARVGVTRGGRELAPRFVTLVLYKVRWNGLHGWQPDASLRPVERRALHGFRALHAANEPLQARLTALRAYAEAGGDRVSEALAVLLYRAGQLDAAERALTAAQSEGTDVRLRNYAAGITLAAGAPTR